MEDVTAEQLLQTRDKFLEKVSSKNADFCAKDIERAKTDDVWLRRFIAHVEFDCEAASQMLFDTCQWRKEFGTNELTHKSMPSHLFDKGVLFIRNQDVYGKKLLIFKAKFHTKGVEDMENLKKFIVYHFERIERASKSDRISIVFDMEETGWGNMDMDFTRYLITLLKTYYPYFVNYLMIYEMPWLLNAAWKIIKTWLPPKFVDRVKFVNKKSIKEFIDENNQLAEWGGKDNYKYKFEPEVLETTTTPAATVNDSRGNDSNVQTRRDKLNLRGIEEVRDYDDANSKTPTPSPRSVFPEPIRRMNIETPANETNLVQVPERIVLTKEGTDRVSGRFQVRNIASSNEALLFKIKTTAPEKFHVRPTIGLLETNASGTVIITVQSMGYLRSIGHERFQVQVVIAPKQLIDGLNGNDESSSSHSEFLGDLGKVWKNITSKDMRIENHRVSCSLDPAILESIGGSGGGGNLVTMNEEEMRKGLNQIEQRIVENVKGDFAKKYARMEKLLYAVIGMMLFLLLSVWWSPSSNVPASQYCEKP